MDFMMPIVRNAAFALLLSSASVLSAFAQTPLPDAIAAPGETVVLTLHAEGAQMYECKAGADGKLAWAFREPIAALLLDGKTVGRHYSRTELGTHRLQRRRRQGGRQCAWCYAERYPLAETDRDLRTRHRNPLRRHHRAANQHGGRQARGRVRQAGSYRNAPYSADYVFLRKG
jgi:hypothetical protein